ncbi:acyl-[acyl-carrier-protein] thioesterase [Paenibacillus sp. MABNR03]|uniref:acyl-[acyl-carrier-protein] thioesterase n=1 Tax=Paenibacillus sp. MABNR03 TaxID=3142626 RepID=UPI003D2CC497
METELPYTFNYRIGSSEADYKSLYRPSALLEHMQLAADRDLASMGITVSEMLDQGMGWMLITTDLTILRQARLEEDVSLQTWHKGNKGVMWLRDYVLTDAKGNPIAEARTSWALVDLEKRKILRPSALPLEVKSHPDLSLGAPPEKVAFPPTLETKEEYRLMVRYSSTDSNGHMNNARYADVCCDALSSEELNNRLTRMQISYHREMRMQEELVVERTKAVDGVIWIRGRSGAEEQSIIFEAKLSFENVIS